MSPPTIFGLHNVSQAISVFPFVCASPFQRNLLHITYTLCSTCLGKRNICAQKVRIEIRTLLTNCNLPAKDRNLTVHVEILPNILSRRGWHCSTESFLELRGTPRYLKASSPLVNSVCCSINYWVASNTPPKYIQLLFWLGMSQDTLENFWKHSCSRVVEGITPLQNSRRSSAKLSCMIWCLWHLGWNSKLFFLSKSS